MIRELPIGYDLSPWAQTYVEGLRQRGMFRDPARTCSRGELEALLGGHQLPISEPLFDFEYNLGGWSSHHQSGAHGWGVYLSLQGDAAASRVAIEFRQASWIFDVGQNEPHEDGDASPVWGTGYPRAFFLERPLVPAGMAGEDVIYFLGELGEVYAFIPPLNQIYLCAGSGRTLLERNGLNHLKGQTWLEAHVCADVGYLLADALGVPLHAPACDQFFRYWANENVQVQRCPDFPPCVFGTRIACRREADFLTAMRLAAETLGPEPVRVWRNANNAVADSGIQFLSKHGFPHQVVVGAGDGQHGWIEANDPSDNRLVRYVQGKFEPAE